MVIIFERGHVLRLARGRVGVGKAQTPLDVGVCPTTSTTPLSQPPTRAPPSPPPPQAAKDNEFLCQSPKASSCPVPVWHCPTEWASPLPWVSKQNRGSWKVFQAWAPPWGEGARAVLGSFHLSVSSPNFGPQKEVINIRDPRDCG